MKSIYLKLIIAFCLLAIIPIITISFFNHPTIDDFWEIGMVKQHGFPYVIYEWSHNVNGRFAANGFMAIISLPFKNILPYKITPVLFIVLFYIVSIKLSKILFKEIVGNFEAVTLGVLFATCYFLDLPELYQGLYWLTSSVNYLLSIIAFLFILYWQKKADNKNLSLLKGFLLFLASFVASGLNELVTFMWIGVTIAYMLLDKYRKQPVNTYKITTLIASLLSLSIQLLSLGNYNRVAYFDGKEGWSNTKSSIMAIEQTSFHLFKHSLVSPLWWFVGLYFFVLLLKNKEKIKHRFNYLHPKLIIIASLFIIIMFFLPALIDGNIERNLSGMRIINVSYFVSFSGFLFLILCTVVNFPIKIDAKRLLNYQQILFALAIICVVFLPGNFRDVSKDLLNGKAALYNKEAYARYKILEDCKSQTCGIPAFTNRPISLCPINDNRINLIRIADVFKKEEVFIIEDSLSKP